LASISSASSALMRASKPGAAVDRRFWNTVCRSLKPVKPSDWAKRTKLEGWMAQRAAIVFTDRMATSFGFCVRNCAISLCALLMAP
jgi:hypothetical protein